MSKNANPSGKRSSYDPSMCDAIRTELANGHTLSGSCPTLGVSLASIYRWRDEHPEFNEAILDGIRTYQTFLEKLLKAHLMGVKSGDFDPKKASLTALIFSLKTRFHDDFGDKSKVKLEGSGPKTAITLAFNLDDEPS